MYETDQIYELQSRKIPGSRDFAKSRPVSPGIENSWSRWGLMVRHSYSFLSRSSTPTLSLCQIPQPSCSFWVSWRTCVRTSYLLPQNAPILTLNACTIHSHYWIRIRLHRNALQVESVQNWPCHLSELPSFRPNMLYLGWYLGDLTF